MDVWFRVYIVRDVKSLIFTNCEQFGNFVFVLSLTISPVSPLHIIYFIFLSFDIFHTFRFFISFSDFLAILQNSVQIAIQFRIFFFLVKEEKPPQRIESEFQNFFGVWIRLKFFLKMTLQFFPPRKVFGELFCNYRADCFTVF